MLELREAAVKSLLLSDFSEDSVWLVLGAAQIQLPPSPRPHLPAVSLVPGWSPGPGLAVGRP